VCVCVWENCIMCGINSHRLPFVRTTSTSLTFIGFGGHSHLMLTTCSAPQPPFETPCAPVQSVPSRALGKGAWQLLHVNVVDFLLFVRLLTLNAVNGFENWQDTVQDTGQ